MIGNEIENDLYNYIGGICKDLECNPAQVGGHKIHIHLLCLLSRKIAQMTLVQQVKQGSSKWIKTIDARYADFYWSQRLGRYGIFSVSPKRLDTVIEYINNQYKHHQKMSFKDEYKKFLKQYGIDFDERYVWD